MSDEIDINKQYRTKNGREVRIYATDGGGTYSVHGAILKNGSWGSTRWNKYGVDIYGSHDGDNLVEVKPRIKRTYWANIYPHYNIGMCEDKNVADDLGNRNPQTRLACVKIEIDCEEGEGL
jgi:hypothetical protein